MHDSKVKNVIFDIGNVVVIWSPFEIVERTFGSRGDAEKLIQQIFHNEIWKQLNLGVISESEAKSIYCTNLKYTDDQIESLFVNIKETQELIDGTVELIEVLRNAGYKLYALSDNVNEIIEYLKIRYNFWELFHGVVISSEVKALKPNPEIFKHLLTKYDLKSSESIFVDDYPKNIQGAKDLGFTTITFKSAKQCESELRSIGLRF